MRLTNADIQELTDWRRALHQMPELSGEEVQTAAEVVKMLKNTQPDEIITGLGGHGVAAIYDSGIPGPRVMLRCELDGLPIEELTALPYASIVPGKAHLCGHDGHMSMLAAMARLISRRPPARGAVILMFQPAEENGAGARAVVADPCFGPLAPDYVFAIHNMPGLPLGQVAIGPGPAACASRGMRIDLTGQTAHAAEPEMGRSPMAALSELMPAMTALSNGVLEDPDYRLVTVTHASMGAPSFGVAPGEASLFVTLRSLLDETMQDLVTEAEAMVRAAAARSDLSLHISYEDVFDATINAPEAAQIVTRALDRVGVPYASTGLPIHASEDVGCFGNAAPLAFMLLGAGETCPAVHTPTYDFPDDLIAQGAKVYDAVLAEVLGES